MPVIHVDSIDDARVDPYRNLKDRELARNGGLFIAEGPHLVRRLIASDYPVHSVLLAEQRLAEFAPLIETDTPVYVLSAKDVDEIIGYAFHSGVMAVGKRKGRATLEQLLPRDGPLTLVICPEIANAENMGAMVRVAAGFGVDAMLLGERCCDPFWRQAVRVSMGTIFRLPLLQCDDLLRDMHRLADEWDVELAATVLADDAEPLATARRPKRLGLLFGNEAQGLEDKWVNACARRITIPMKLGTDSLNVAVSAGIFLYHFTRADVVG
jgi:tRNA G18 (ribose-2'-O)-methylase SpoU